MSDAFLGEIRMFAGNYAPVNWVLCNGQLLSISQYSPLFTVLGTTYGGDGVNTFAVPDMRGRLPVQFGQGPGLTARTLGANGGSETVVLSTTQMPAHGHTMQASTNPASATDPNGNVLATVTGTFYELATAANNLKNMSAQTVGAVGGGAGHNNMMPTLAVNFIMCTAGVFPPQQ